MITRLLKSDYLETLWKNGGGKTQQIEIFPENSSVAENNFLYRLSSATVAESGPFSPFKGYERLLVVWRGEGLCLNGIDLLPFTPLAFSGEESIDCEVIGNEAVVDLGLIYDKKKYRAKMEVKTIEPGHNILVTADLTFLFVARGSGQFETLDFEEGDTLKCESEQGSSFKLETRAAVVFFEITLNTIL